jgi:hypothetical protein
LTVIASLAVLLIAFLAGRFTVDPDRPSGLEDGDSAIGVRLADSEAELERTRQIQANLQAALDVEREASAKVRGELAEAQAAIAQVEQEVDLYRGLLDSSAQQSGLAVHQFEIEQAGAANAYRYRLILVQRTRRYSEIGGTLKLAIRGSAEGVPRVLPLSEVGIPRGTGSLPLRLMYFQVIEGEFDLPTGFAPKEVLIDAEVTTGRRQRLAVRRDWKL